MTALLFYLALRCKLRYHGNLGSEWITDELGFEHSCCFGESIRIHVLGISVKKYIEMFHNV